MTVREATLFDFDAIYQLLKRLNDTSLSRSDWERITKVDFNSSIKTYGFVLEEDSEILGFLGTIFSNRNVNDQDYKFCNIHSWIVEPKAKTGGMALLLAVLRKKDYVITNFTASEIPYKIFKSLKFKEIEYKNFKLLPLQSSVSLKTVKILSVTDRNAKSLLNADEFKLYEDHKRFTNTQFLYVNTDQESSFVITKHKSYVPGIFNKVPVLNGILKTKLALAEIHYIRNEALFFRAFSNTLTAIRICKTIGSVGILVANRYLPKTSSLKKAYYPSKRPYLYRHTDDDKIVDTLYSEFFVLNF